jgi:uncharacterized protein (TIGR00369 family)
MVAHIRERSIAASPFTAFLGINLVRCWQGEAELVMPIRTEHTQHRGTVHGGVLGCLADNVCGYAAASLVGAVITSNYTLHLLAPADGERIRATARTVRAGGRLATVTADLFAERGEDSFLVATAIAAFVVLR